jgi:hypothetical protein
MFGNSSLRHKIKILWNYSVEEIARLFDEAVDGPNKNKIFCVTFRGGSQRMLLQHHDLGNTVGNYSISTAGRAFVRLSSRIRRINIFNPNVNLEISPVTGPFAHLRGGDLAEARKRRGNINLDCLEFIQLHCGNTLTELSIPAFDRGLEWSVVNVDDCFRVERCGRAISAFDQLKSLNISRFECGCLCFQVLLLGLTCRADHMTSLEAIDVSHNNINLECANIIKTMLMNGKILRLDASHITSRMSAFGLYRSPETSANAAPVLKIISGCCHSCTIGVVRMEHITGCAMNIVYSSVVDNFKNGKLKLFEFKFGKNELLSREQKQTIIECRERNSERWMIAKRLEANNVNMIEMRGVILRIKWDTSLLYDAMRLDASRIRFFVTQNKAARLETTEYPKRKTRTAIKAWNDSHDNAARRSAANCNNVIMTYI